MEAAPRSKRGHVRWREEYSVQPDPSGRATIDEIASSRCLQVNAVPRNDG
jgi:hypothetical protein